MNGLAQEKAVLLEAYKCLGKNDAENFNPSIAGMRFPYRITCRNYKRQGGKGLGGGLVCFRLVLFVYGTRRDVEPMDPFLLFF